MTSPAAPPQPEKRPRKERRAASRSKTTASPRRKSVSKGVAPEKKRGKEARPSRASPAPRRASKKPSLHGESLFTRGNAWLTLVLLLLGLAGIIFYPFSTPMTRSAALLLSGAALALFFGLTWRVRFIRWSMLALVAGCTLFLSLPGRTNYDRLALRNEFAMALRRYQGTRCHPGGEGFFAIDGQGLIRRASTEAPLIYGLRTANPWLVRRAFQGWWDRDLPLGKWPACRRISKVKSLHGFNDLILYAGDFALLNAKEGEPAEAVGYLGHHQWIVAGGEYATVTIVDGRTGDPAMQLPGALFRWRLLEARR